MLQEVLVHHIQNDGKHIDASESDYLQAGLSDPDKELKLKFKKTFVEKFL